MSDLVVRAPRRTTHHNGQRIYEWAGERYWSVTTILGGVLAKPALPYWAAKETAMFAIDNLPQIRAIAAKDRDAAVQMVKGAPWRSRDKAANLGNLIHSIAESIATEAFNVPMSKLEDLTEEDQGKISAFHQFVEDWKPQFQLIETTVFNRRYRYAGTCDFAADFGKGLVMGDIKTGKGVYAEAALQLCAYRHAEFTVVDGEEHPLPALSNTGVILHLTPTGYKLYPVDIGPDVFETFTAVRQVWGWRANHEDGAIGAPLPERTNT
jgi:hypothetical protein